MPSKSTNEHNRVSICYSLMAHPQIIKYVAFKCRGLSNTFDTHNWQIYFPSIYLILLKPTSSYCEVIPVLLCPDPTHLGRPAKFGFLYFQAECTLLNIYILLLSQSTFFSHSELLLSPLVFSLSTRLLCLMVLKRNFFERPLETFQSRLLSYSWIVPLSVLNQQNTLHYNIIHL